MKTEKLTSNTHGDLTMPKSEASAADILSASENCDDIPNNPDSATPYRDDRYGSVRHAAEIHSGGRGIFITTTNVADLFQNFEHAEEAQSYARAICMALSSDALRLPSEQGLAEILEAWTGGTPYPATAAAASDSSTPVYVRIELYYYLDLNWTQNREIIFVAATADSLPLLCKHSGYARIFESRIDRSAVPVATQDVLTLLAKRKSYSAARNLSLAIRRCLKKITPIVTAKEANDADAPVLKARDARDSSSSTTCAQVVHPLYQMYKIGRREPDESFLYVHFPQRPDKARVNLASAYLRDLRASPQTLVLVVAATDRRDWFRLHDDGGVARPLCIFGFTDSSIDEDDLIATLRAARHVDELCHTVLRGRFYEGCTGESDNGVSAAHMLEDIDGKYLLGFVPRRQTRDLIGLWIRELDPEGSEEDEDEDGDGEPIGSEGSSDISARDQGNGEAGEEDDEWSISCRDCSE